jgi:hypothetical protein
MISDFAETLFFTRAAVEADPALANVRIEGPAAGKFGLVSMQGRPDLPDVPALSFAALFRVWDDIAASLPCPRCGARRLFLGATGGATHRLIAFIRLHCPFCHETEGRSESRWADYKAVRETVRAARLALADSPAGLPFDEAMQRLRALRAADLAVLAHPLERRSLAAARVVPPVLSGRAADAVRDARLRALVSAPDLLDRARSVRDGVLAAQRRRVAEAEAALAPLRGRPGEPGPKARFKRGELTEREYCDILRRRRELAEPIDPRRLRRELEDALVRAAEKALGGPIGARARELVLAAVEEASADNPGEIPKIRNSESPRKN